MSDSESDLDIKSALPMPGGFPKKPASSPTEDLKKISKMLATKTSKTIAKSQEKMPLAPEGKKLTTKMMIIDALTELHTRKGVSLYAIKQFLTQKYEVNTAKANYLIKKSLKAGVEDKTFVQIKGIGASGSFKLATSKEKKVKPILKKKIEDKTEKPKKKVEKIKKVQISKKVEEIQPKKVKGKDKQEPKTKGVKTSKKVDVKIDNDGKKKMVKSAKMMTPVKKAKIMKKRKSIGSIIKPPRMNPKSRA